MSLLKAEMFGLMTGLNFPPVLALLGVFLTLRLTAGVTRPFCQDTLGMQKNPVLSTDFVFHDAWGPKLINSEDGRALFALT